jgi:transglutaminase/protease-like cytokinesis protein 3
MQIEEQGQSIFYLSDQQNIQMVAVYLLLTIDKYTFMRPLFKVWTCWGSKGSNITEVTPALNEAENR